MDVGFDPLISERLGLAAILLLSGLGLLAGIVSGSGPPSGPFGYDVKTAHYMAARDFANRPKSRLPHLPRGIFLALLFSAYPLLKNWCPAFMRQHAYFTFVYVCCGVSTAVWLIIASFLQPVPNQDIFPFWLKHWNWVNIGGFLFLMAVVVNSFAKLFASA